MSDHTVGYFTVDESCRLLELVLNQQKTKNFDDVVFEKVNFSEIGEMMRRSESPYFLSIFLPK